MPLSAHERNEFERLTADLAIDDSNLKKMAKRERSTEMDFIPLPRFSKLLRRAKAIPGETIALVLILVGFTAIPVSAFFLWSGNIKGVIISMLIGGLIISVADLVDTQAKKNTNRR